MAKGLDYELGLLHKKLKYLATEVEGGREMVGHKGGPLKRALMAGAKPMLDDMKSGAPVGKPKKAHISRFTGKMIPARKGGLLRESIRRERFRKPEELLDATEGVLVRPNHNKAPHFHLVEFGTERMAANPYMRPAFDKNQDIAVDIFKQKLATDIDKIAKKLRVMV